MDHNFFEELKYQSQLNGIIRFVVAAVILNHDNQVLLLKRPENEFMGGIYELPSGKVEHGESLSEALIREVEEETSLCITKVVSYLGHFDYLSQKSQKTRQFNFIVETLLYDQIQLSEHESYVWQSLENVQDCNITDSTINILLQVMADL
jgi:8-oxo-dGTP diphosphatase